MNVKDFFEWADREFIEERTCMTCILKNEDPEVISEPYGNYLSDRDKLNI